MSRVLRTFHIRIGSPYGGVERFLEHLFRHTSPETYDAELISLVQDCELAERVRGMGRPVSILPMNHRWSIGAARQRIMACIERSKPDVIHTYGLRSNLVAGPLAKRMGIPWVVRLPNVNRFDYINPWAGWASYLLNNELLRRADAVHVISPMLQNHVQNLWRPPKRVVLIPNGVDTARFIPGFDRAAVRAELSQLMGLQLAGVPVGLSIGRLLPLKGFDLLLEAWVEVRKQIPDAVLLILGEGPIYGVLQAQCERLGLTDAVRLPGFIKDLVLYFQAATLYIQSSRTEGVSQTVLEAMACGLPVVATDVGGTNAVVNDRVTGRLVPRENVQKLTEAIIETITNPGLAAEWGQAGLGAARNQWSLERMVQSVLDLDYELAGGR